MAPVVIPDGLFTVRSLWRGVLLRRPAMNEIALHVADQHGLDLEDMIQVVKRKRAPKPIIRARQEAMTLMHRRGRYDKVAISLFFGLNSGMARRQIASYEARMGV